jgi:glycyl-tRNA synthetase beta chain
LAKTLLLEIGTEEMPARFLLPAIAQLRELMAKRLADLRLSFGTIRTVGTPRRLAAIVTEVAEHQAPIVREVRGPARHIAFDAQGNPTKAAEGFARAQGVAVSELVVKATEKGEFVFAIKREEGRPAMEVLSEALPQVIRQLAFPKTMRWEASGLRFGRPIRWLVALLGETVIPFEVAGVQSDRITYGRRFTDGQLAGKPIALTSADLYETALELAHVIVDYERRRAMTKAQVESVAEKLGGVALMPDELLDEVTFLVEEPVALVGSFDRTYLTLPTELLVTVMMHHQRYFPVVETRDEGQGTEGKLLPHFIFVCNGMPGNPEAVRKGNEKVIAARFEDARFYFALDRQRRLAEFVPLLSDIVFQQGLGTMGEKTQRLKTLVDALCQHLQVDPQIRALALRAAELGKADLATRLVSEFPELQGVIGRIYALLDGEPDEVAWAIEDHYKPQPPDYALPRHLVGVLLAIADRLDTLCACFDRDLIPTGSHDPLGLRRTATTLLMLLRDADEGKSLPLTFLLDLTLRVLREARTLTKELTWVAETVRAFLRERLEALLEGDGIDHDVRRAVLAVGFDEVPSVFARAQTLHRLRQQHPERFRPIVEAFTRVTNILAQARQKGEPIPDQLNLNALSLDAERALAQATEQVAPAVMERVRVGDYEGAFWVLAELAPTIHRFFDEVLVMHEDERLRRNRLALLRQVERLLRLFADFASISAVPPAAASGE